MAWFSRTIVLDNRTQFTSAQLKEYCKNRVEEVVAEVAVREKKAYAEEGVDE